MTTDEMKSWLSDKLGREVTVSKIRFQGVEGYLADYINHSAPATKLAGVSEEEAISNLFYYLQALKPVSDAGDIDITTKE